MPPDTPTKRIVHENGVRNYVVGGRRETQLAGRQIVKNQLDQTQRLEQFVEAHRDPRGNVALPIAGDLDAKLIVGRTRVIDPEVAGLAAGPRRKTHQTELSGELRSNATGGDKAIL